MKSKASITSERNIPESGSDWLMQTERLRLRPVTIEDAALLLAVWNDPAFIRHVGDRGVRTPEEARDAIVAGALKLFEEYGYGPYCLSLKETNQLIGICGLFKRDNLDDADIGFSVLPEYCKKGYASEAASAVVDYAGKELGLERLTAIVSPTNAASIGLIEKLGLTYVRPITMPDENEAISLYSMTLDIDPIRYTSSMTDSPATTDWRKLREFSAVDLTQSFVLSWHAERSTLVMDIDVFLTPEHPFYEKPRPAERICIRPAVLEFPLCDEVSVSGRDAGSLSEILPTLGLGAITGLLRHDDGRHEISGKFGTVFVDSERPLLRLKGP